MVIPGVFLLLAWIQGAQSPLTFSSEGTVVSIDVFVTDRQGRPVRDLQRSDFQVIEDHKTQAVTSFQVLGSSAGKDEETNGSALGDRRGALPTSSRRALVLVVDDLHLTAAQGARVQSAVRAFVDTPVTHGDSITLVAPGARIWSHDVLPEGREQLLALSATVAGRWGRSGPLLRPELRAMRSTIVDALGSALMSLEGARAQKAVFLVSRGYSYLTRDQDARPDYERLVRLSHRVNAPLYFLDVRGLESIESNPPQPMDGISRPASGFWRMDRTSFMDGLALDTGGLSIRNANDFSKPIARVLEGSEQYYAMGYISDRPPRPGEFRRIKIKVNRKGLRVRARRGYYG